jgi:hypothetical protein
VLARSGIALYAAVMMTMILVGLPVRYAALTDVCATPEGCPALHLSPLEVAAMPAWLDLGSYARYLIGIELLYAIAALALAGLVFARRSHTRIGLLTAAAFVSFALSDEIALSLGRAVFPLAEPLLRGALSLSIVLLWLFALVFPDGTLRPAWVRRSFPLLLIAWGVRISLVLWLGVEHPVPTTLLFALLFVPVFAQVARYRRYAVAEQRQQVKWSLFGLVGILMATVLWTTVDPSASPFPNGAPRLVWNLIGITLAFAASSLLLVALTVSILRHRLWDIDVIINRALVYGSLTLTLTGIYLGTVIFVQRVVLSGQESPLVVAGSTLLIAALFAPLRRRIQRFIDGRFYRRKVDGRHALEAFAVTARAQVDLDALTTELLHVVGSTLQPRLLGLWLKPDPQRYRGDPS